MSMPQKIKVMKNLPGQLDLNLDIRTKRHFQKTIKLKSSPVPDLISSRKFIYTKELQCAIIHLKGKPVMNILIKQFII